MTVVVFPDAQSPEQYAVPLGSRKQFDLQSPHDTLFYSEAGRLPKRLYLGSNDLLDLLSLKSALLQS